MSFEKLITIITGGASGIGRALGEELGRRGATVILADINSRGVQEAADAIAARGRSASSSCVDVRQSADVQKLVDDTVRRHGRLDLLFNNAGIGVGGALDQLSLDHWRAAIEVNLLGVVHGVAAAYPVMIRQGAGQIVNIASLAGLIASPGLGPYATTKGAVVALTGALRAEGEALGVRANVVCPGFVDTAIYENAIGVKVDKDELLARLRLPLMPAQEGGPGDSARCGTESGRDCFSLERPSLVARYEIHSMASDAVPAAHDPRSSKDDDPITQSGRSSRHPHRLNIHKLANPVGAQFPPVP